MSQGKHKRAFTLAELLAVMVVIVVLVGLLLPALARARPRTKRINCTIQLRQVGLAFRIFSTDNEDRYPMRVKTNATLLPPPTFRPAFFYAMMSNELSTPRILVCPNDRRIPATHWSALAPSNISYFIGTAARETEPQVWLSGDRNFESNGVAVGPGLLRLTTNMSMGWTAEMHNRSGNVVLGDGSVQQITSPRLQSMLSDQVAVTNELLVP